MENYKTQNVKQLYNCLKNKFPKEEIYSKFSNISWDERTMTEIITIKPNSNNLIIYNIYLDKYDEITTKYFFGNCFSILNLNPYFILSGGIYNGQIINNIRRYKRIGNDDLEEVELNKLNENRFNHNNIYIQFDNSIIFLGGERKKTCEKLYLNDNKIEKFPSLNFYRERFSLCLINETIIYVFFGYDLSISKYLTNIEKIDIKNPNYFEIININGEQKNLKRTNFCCVNYFNKKENKNGIFIVGGKNGQKEKVDDILFYNINKNEMENNSKLNEPSSFINNYFINFDFNDNVKIEILWNINEKNKIIKFNNKLGKFYCE